MRNGCKTMIDIDTDDVDAANSTGDKSGNGEVWQD